MKKMIRFINLNLWLYLFALVSNAQSINYVEYFIDADPGYGNGISISISPSDTIETDFSIPTAVINSLNAGIHNLYVRSQDEENNWSLDYYKQFYLEPENNSNLINDTTAIVYAEYFIDSDPGYGNGTSISISPSDTIETDFSIPTPVINSLNAGIHNLYVRSQDGENNWSLDYYKQFYLEPENNSNLINDTTAIVYAEYFIDSDPGYGNGTSISISPSDTIETDFSIPISVVNSLNAGIHNLYVRSQDEESNWSLDYYKQFYLEPENNSNLINDTTAIVYAEYFIDSDPGYGNGTSISISPSDTIETDFSIPTTVINSLNAGIHNLYVRSQDEENNWSLDYYKQFYLEPENNSNLINDTTAIVYVEYFIDNDPGYGNATSISISPSDTIETDFSIPTSVINSLNEGEHNLYVRSQDEEGHWSLDYYKQFYLEEENNNNFNNDTTEIVYVEYFIDNDPGYGNATSISIIPSDTIETDFTIPTSIINSLNEGEHNLYIRSQDEEGHWSLDYYRQFYLEQESNNNFNNDTTEIVYVEYFIDNDPGYGNATSISISPSDTIETTFSIPTSVINSLNVGIHNIYVRSQDDEGHWSLDYYKQSYIEPEYIGNLENNNKQIIAAEYFVGEDPGFGNGTSIGINPNDTLMTTFDIPTNVINSLSAGIHSIYLRVMDEEGHWSMQAQKEFQLDLAEDLEILSLDNPKSNCALSKENIVVSIKNNGTENQSNVELIATINDTLIIREIYNGTLNFGDTLVYTFNQSIDFNIYGNYTLEVEVVLTNDETLSNNISENTIKIVNFGEVTPLNLVPVDDQQEVNYPIQLSWSPSNVALTYDVYVWKSGDTQPTNPTILDINQFFTVLQNNPQLYQPGETYNWFVEANSGFCESQSSIQSFTITNFPDLVIQNIQIPTMPFSGQSIQIDWEVHNIGLGDTENTLWYDRVYLSNTANIDASSVYLGAVLNTTSLNAGESYSSSILASIPKGYDGEYYIVIETDAYNRINEAFNDNNTNASIINVTLTPPPDLVVNFVNIQSSTFSGENLTYSYQIKNNGTGVTTENYWQDHIFISESDLFDENSAEYLGLKERKLPLKVDSTYTINDSITLPDYVIGEYYVYVLTDYNNQVYEFAFEDNNIGISNLVEIFLTPPPDLELDFIITPDTIYPNESISINYQYSNAGAADAFYPWQDRFYLSPDQESITNGILLNSTNNNVITYISPEFGTPTVISDFEYDSGAQSEIIIDRNIIPSNLTNGQYYVHGRLDYFNQIFEFDQEDDNNLAVPVILETPDLIPLFIDNPGSIQTGKTVNISYVVRNDNRGKVINRNNEDKIYLSTDTSISDDDTLLHQNSYTLNLNQESELSKNVSITIPDGLQYNYYLIVETDADSQIIEPNENNNSTSVPIIIELSPYADLVANSITNLPDTVTAMIETLSFNYSVNNEGDTITNSNEWLDKIYVSLSPVFNPDEKFIQLASKQRFTALNKNESYSESMEFSFPMVSALLPDTDSATVYIHLITDVNDEVYEIDGVSNNNTYSSNPIYVICPPPVDLNITQMSTLPKDTFLTGEKVSLTWSVQNLGNTTALWDYTIWYDGIYLSPDPIWDPSDLFIEDFTQTGPLDSLAFYNDAKTITIPNGISGHYCLMLVVDNQVYLNDNITTNNIGIFPGNMPGPNMYIQEAPSPDLEASNFRSPINGLAGQPIEIVTDVMNVGLAATKSDWNDKVYLSTDFKIDYSDKIISTKVKNNLALNANESYSDTIEIILPNDEIGNYVILFKTDAGNGIYEDGNEENNILYNFITITEAPPSDLIVSSANYPDTAFVNQKIDINYTVENQGIFPASGIQTDILYLSIDSILDAGDAIVGFNEITDTILPTESKNRKAEMLCTPGTALGDYFVLVQADALNNIAESSDTNNVYISPTKMSISVPELALNTIVDETLMHQMSEFYFIQIDDSLKNQTLKITLTGDAFNGNNEMYLSFEQIPTLANQDYSFDIPFSGNQTLLVPELSPGIYYLNVYGQHTNSLSQNATLFAEIIDFEITSITANSGGNTGNVTVLLKGARFTETMSIELQKAGSPTIYAQNIYLNNSIEAFVTFNLNAADIGKYDVFASKINGETTVLANAFEVVEGAAGTFGGANDQTDNGFYCNISNIGTENLLSQNIIHPASVRVGRNVPITIQFGNNGNVDIPAPSRFIISLRGAPLAFEIEDLAENKQDLFLEFEETNGPSGILRPGAVGSITVYSYSSHPLRFLLNE